MEEEEEEEVDLRVDGRQAERRTLAGGYLFGRGGVGILEASSP